MEADKRVKLPLIIVIAAVIVLAVVLIALSSDTGAIAVKGTHVHFAAVPERGRRVEARDDYILVSESDDYRLYYYEPHFSVKIEDKKTGAVIES
nr:hypothetical protein [Oscillospiraceae bacterium]